MFPSQPVPQGGRQIPGMPPAGRNPSPIESDPMDPHRNEQQEKMRNNDRQKRLVADTEKLLALATDLKAQVDKSNKDTLSVDVIKKAEEIEKLAHSVKERMKG
jgi:nitric oxide reductase activation protein